ncbi:MAG TPA: cation:proton antiporter [Terriglobales bacterium]|nr:cation:proton antiporter [Terriglobales bacterium]
MSSLLSGFVERTGLPQVVVFLALGAVLGPFGIGLVDIGVDSPILRVVATLSLALVLFMDAVSLNMSEVRKHRLLGFLVLGPGTLLSAALVAGASVWLLHVPLGLAAILGAALASTDPVLLRGIMRNPQLTSPVRQALRIESGLNDVVLLPIVIVGIAAATTHAEPGAAGWAKLALNMAILSPAAGIIVALCAIGALEVVRRRSGVRRDYESIYSLGVALAAFAAAEAVHGSGFIAAFAAGITIAMLDVELCDCFIEYGETTAEMALLFTFVLFGVSLIWQGVAKATPLTVVFAIVVILIRPLAFIPSLTLAKLTWRDRALLGWFGPRGLSTLLLILLPVFALVPGSDFLLSVCCLVVLVSVLLHGFSPMFLLRTPPQPPTKLPIPPTQQQESSGSASSEAPLVQISSNEYIEPDQLRRLQDAGNVIVADARSIRSFDESTQLLEGAVRLNPEHAVRDARALNVPTASNIAVFCA